MSKSKYFFAVPALAIISLFAALSFLIYKPVVVSAQANNPFSEKVDSSDRQCGKGETTYTPVIDIGCQGDEYRGQALNPIMDMIFALLRFLTLGIGIVAIASVVVAGIQFGTSRGDPGATAKAISRIASTIGALLLYILAWALLNWLVPGGVFNG